MAKETCAQCGATATSGGALCSPCRRELAEKAAAAQRKRKEGGR